MSHPHHDADTGLTDQLEFELRLIPGIVGIGTARGRLSIAATSEEAAGRARELARARLGADVEIGTVTSPAPDRITVRTVEAILEVAGVRTCAVRRAEESGTVLDITVDSVRAADVVHDLVADTFGEAFAEERMQVALEIPLMTTTGT